MFKHTCAVVSTAALLAGTSVPSSAQDAPTTAPTIPAFRKPSLALPSRVFIDVNGGFQSSTLTFSDTRNDPFFGETASWNADYETKSGPVFDVAGGVRVWRNLVASVAYSRFTDTSVAAIEGGVPHPFFFNQTRAIAGEAVGLKQQEDVIHMSAMWVVPAGRWFDVRVFGGPSLYRIKRDLVADIVYAEDGYPYDTASFSSAQVERVHVDAWGFHVGGDVTWMFTHTVGLGATARFSRAEPDVTSPANGDPLTLRLGGLQFGGGLRFRFGRAAVRKEAGSPRPAQPETLGPRSAEPTTDRRPPDSPQAVEVEPRIRESAVMVKDTPVFVRPGVLQPLKVLRAGTRVKVREQVGEWLMIEFKDDQWGVRVGFVLRADSDWK